MEEALGSHRPIQERFSCQVEKRVCGCRDENELDAGDAEKEKDETRGGRELPHGRNRGFHR